MTTGDNEVNVNLQGSFFHSFGFSGFMKNLKKTHDKDIPQVWYRSEGLLRPVSNFGLLLCY